jgi:hypothetical protein
MLATKEGNNEGTREFTNKAHNEDTPPNKIVAEGDDHSIEYSDGEMRVFPNQDYKHYIDLNLTLAAPPGSSKYINIEGLAEDNQPEDF